MSRSTVAKSRADKGGKSGYGSAPTPAVTHEIVAGKFNDQDWNLMIEHDEGDEFIQDIVEEICSSVLENIHQNYLQRQLIPYTVLQAKDAMLQIIEWQFLAHDKGESDVQSNLDWVEDEEPDCAVTDCWAQGSVPINVYPSTPRSVVLDVLSEEPPVQQEGSDEREGETEVEATVENSSIVIEESEITEPSLDEQQGPVKSEQQKKKKAFKPHYGPLRQAQMNNMSESLEQTEMGLLYEEMQTSLPPKTPETAIFHMPNSCHSIIKLQAGRPPGTRDVIYDNAGNVVSITKLNPERLPSHRVRTGFHVVDPQVEAAQARLEAMRTGRHLKIKKPAPPATNKPKGETILKRGRKKQPTTSTAVVRSSRDDIAQLPPPLIDAMELAPGVLVREGDRIKRGPKQHSSKSDFSSMVHRNLRPVVANGESHVFSVQDLLGNQQPIIRPFGSPPIPPIMPHPPSQKAS